MYLKSLNIKTKPLNIELFIGKGSFLRMERDFSTDRLDKKERGCPSGRWTTFGAT